MAWNIHDPSFYNPEHFVVRHMYDSDHAALVWFGFQRGQTLRDHETTSVAIIQVLRGKIRLRSGDDQVLETGQTVQLEPNVRHALEALDDSLVQLVLVPHPRFHRLGKEID